VAALQLQRERGLPFECVMSMELVANKGIVGDCHALGGEKQIAIISKEAKRRIDNQKITGICYQRFQENMVIDGIEFDLLNAGDILVVNDVKIEVSSYTKRCFPECLLSQKKEDCHLKSQIRFATVLQSGKITVSDNVIQKKMDKIG
jgi:MOSC domain-containing protein YiiM